MKRYLARKLNTMSEEFMDWVLLYEDGGVLLWQGHAAQEQEFLLKHLRAETKQASPVLLELLNAGAVPKTLEAFQSLEQEAAFKKLLEAAREAVRQGVPQEAVAELLAPLWAKGGSQ